MAKSTRASAGKGAGPNVKDKQAFSNWLAKQPDQWSVTIAARAALRVLPLLREANDPVTVLSAFRATAIARFAAKFPDRATETAANAAASMAGVHAAANFAVIAAAAAYGDDARDAGSAASLAAAASTAAAAAAFTNAESAPAAVSAMFAAVSHDAERLRDGLITAVQLATAPLWPTPAPPHILKAWRQLVPQLRGRGNHWSVWIDWYDGVLAGTSHLANSEAMDASYTDISSGLPWESGPEAVNIEIGRRLAELSRASEIPDQSPAPVRVEERHGKVSKASDRDSALSASERDFKAARSCRPDVPTQAPI